MKLKALTAALISVFAATSYAVASSPDYSKEEKIIRALLRPLQVRGIEVKSVKPTNEVKVPGFVTYEVDMIDKNNHREVKRYIFISPDDKYLALEIFSIREEGNTIHLKPLRPKNANKQLKVDLSWLKKVDRELSKNGVPHVIGKGEKKVYIVWDIFCPFCYEHFNQIQEIAKKNGVEIHMIPFPIHGENSIKGLILYTEMARKKGAVEAFKELYKLGNGNFMNYANRMEQKLNSEYSKLPKEEREKLRKLFVGLRDELTKHGVRATPSVIYAPPGSNEGYIYVGFKPIREVIKEQ
jgi:thiol:disulfide interchange protein DsbC